MAVFNGVAKKYGYHSLFDGPRLMFHVPISRSYANELIGLIAIASANEIISLKIQKAPGCRFIVEGDATVDTEYELGCETYNMVVSKNGVYAMLEFDGGAIYSRTFSERELNEIATTGSGLVLKTEELYGEHPPLSIDVKSLQEARRVYLKWQYDTGAGSSQIWQEDTGSVFYEGEFVAFMSYNGRFWTNSNCENTDCVEIEDGALSVFAAGRIAEILDLKAKRSIANILRVPAESLNGGES